MTVAAAVLAAASSSQKTMVLMLAVGILALVPWFFERRIGGKRGGSDKEIVGVIWFLAAVVLGLVLAGRP